MTSTVHVDAGDSHYQTHLVVNFVEGVLQLPVDSSQLFEVPVSFMNWQKNLVHFIYGLIHSGLQLENDKEQTFTNHLIISQLQS